MKVALAVVILGGLLYLEAVCGYVAHRNEQFQAALRDLAWTTKDLADSTQRLADTLVASQHAWGQAIDLVLKQPWHVHVYVDPDS